MIGVNGSQRLKNCGQEKPQDRFENVIKKNKDQGVERDKRLEEKMKELGIKCSKDYLRPFKFRGVYYNFLNDPKTFMETKKIKQNSDRKLITRAEKSYGFKLHIFSRKILRQLSFLRQLNINNIEQIQKSFATKNIQKDVIELMNIIEQQNGVKRQRFINYNQQSKVKEYEMMYEGVVLRYEEDSDRYMQYRRKKSIYLDHYKSKKSQRTHSKLDNNVNMIQQIYESKQYLQYEEPPQQKYQRYIKNLHTQLLRLNQKKDILLKRLNGQTQKPQEKQSLQVVKNARGSHQEMSTLTSQKLKIGSKAEQFDQKGIQQEQEQAKVINESLLQDNNYVISKNSKDIKQENQEIDYYIAGEEMKFEVNKIQEKKMKKRYKTKEKVFQIMKNMKSHEEKIKFIKSKYTQDYLESFSFRGVIYDYRDDPEEFLRQKRIKYCIIYNFQKAADPANPLTYIFQSKIQPVQQMLYTNYKESIHKDNQQYHQNVEQLISRVRQFQLKCWKIRQSVIELMKAQKFKQGLTRKEKEKILCIEPPNEGYSEFELYDRQGVNSPAYRGVYDEQKKKSKVLYNFWFEGVFFDYEQDPNRLKNYAKKKQEERKRYLSMKRKQNKEIESKYIQKIKQQKNSQVTDFIKEEEMFQKHIQNEENEDHIAKLEMYISNLKSELIRLKKKQQRLMKHKSDQDEKEKITEKVNEKLKRKENMNKESEEGHSNINLSTDRLDNVKQEEGQEADSAHQRQQELLSITPVKILFNDVERVNEKTPSHEPQEEEGSSHH